MTYIDLNKLDLA